MGKENSYKYVISIPFSAFLTAISILIAADFILLQLWFNSQSTPCRALAPESWGLAAFLVSYFVVISIVSMILAILDKTEANNVEGRPVILFLFSLLFTMCFVFQSGVTSIIKICKGIPLSTSLGSPNLLLFGILTLIALLFTVWAIRWPEWWDKLFESFKKHVFYLVLAICGILSVVTGGVFEIGRQFISFGAIIGWILIGIGIGASIGACCYCRKKCE